MTQPNQSELEQEIAKIVHRVKSDKFRPLAASVGTRYIMELITANYTPNSEVERKINEAVLKEKLKLWQSVDELAIGYRSFRVSDIARERLAEIEEEES